jgi:tetratricopeptide (TPR) repeat protein
VSVAVLVLALALALPALALAAWPLARRHAPDGGADAEGERVELETEKLAALRALRELELDRQAGHVDDADYGQLRARYEAQAAAVLRRLDALGPAPGRGAARGEPRPGAAATPWTRQPVVLGATGMGLLLFGVVLGLLVSRHTAPAPPAMEPAPAPALAAPPGGPGAGAGGAPRPIPKEMLEGMLRAAHGALDAGRYPEAIAAYKAVLAREPRNVDAITHLGVILARAGHDAEALEAFDRALEIEPDYAHALWDKAQVLEARGDDAGVIATLERFVRVGPAGPDRDRALEHIRAARARQDASAARPAPGAPPPGAPGRAPAARP